MNPLQRTLIEKTGHDHGFEHVVASDASGVTLASARHANRALIDMENGAYQVQFQTTSPSLLSELKRSFPAVPVAEAFRVGTEADLAALLRRAASLSRALPSQAASDFQQAVVAELAKLPPGIVGTEVERVVRQRVGQNKFREAMMGYWGGACAVTGVAIAEVLRASHAKPSHGPIVRQTQSGWTCSTAFYSVPTLTRCLIASSSALMNKGSCSSHPRWQRSTCSLWAFRPA